MPIKKYTKKTTRRPTKNTYARKSATTRAPRADGQSILVSAYFEAQKTLSLGESVMNYSICIDPKAPVIIKGEGVSLMDGAQPPALVGNDTLTLSKWTTFSSLFNQYKINSASMTVRVDGHCGLENAVITCVDKGDSTVVTSMAQAMSGAHKSHSMTASKRELKYGCRNTGQELDFYSTNGNQNMTDSEKKYLKVFQKLPAQTNAGDICEHQIQLMLSLSLKDSKNIV